MTTVLMTLHIILAIAMVGIILIQKNEGGLGMGSGAMGSLMSSRGTANFLTHVTAILATLFFLTTLGLALVFKGANKSQSIFDDSTVTKTVPSVPLTNSEPVTSGTSLPAKMSEGSTKTPNSIPDSKATLPTPSTPSRPIKEGQK